MTFYNDPAIPRFEAPDIADDGNFCSRCDLVIETDDMFEPACSCDPDAHCSDCGEELPEAHDSHCQNCCECDACTEAYDAIEKHHEKTGEWLDNPIITGEKIYSN